MTRRITRWPRPRLRRHARPPGATPLCGTQLRRGQAAGLTLAQIGQVLDIRDRGQAPCRHVTDLLDTRLDVIDRQLAELAQLRTTIADLREDAAAGDPATCSPEDVCRYL